MFIEERYKYILDLLDKNGKVLVKDLSKLFDVSESMIRKDLQILEKKNLLQRTYGGAINIKHTLVNIESFQTRVDQHPALKEAIALKAVQRVNEDDTIFLDASTTSYMITKALIAQNKKVTLITNMIEISSLISQTSDIHFIFIGGDYNALAGGCIGSYAIDQIKGYRCNKAFIGCSGIDLSEGLISTTLSEDASTKKAIMHISKECYLITTNEKFETNGSYNFAHIMDFHGLITEEAPDPSIIEILTDYNVTVY